MNKLQKQILLSIALSIVVSFMPACSMTVQTNDDKFDHVIDNYLPPFTTVTKMTAYDMQKKHGNRITGTMTTSGNVIKTYHIDTINDPIVLLHEICHILEPEFHRGYAHDGLVGCKSFNYDSLNEGVI